jgi:aminoglycoside phosphotransferase family enzyme/predicted kinase
MFKDFYEFSPVIPASTSNREPALDLNVDALLTAKALGHDVNNPRVVETHISWVLLSGEFAYKIRKPVVMPFLDFSTLEARRADCEEEIRLNRRWAPQLYLDIVAIRGPKASPSLVAERSGAIGTRHDSIIDYAVKMRQFADHARLDRAIAKEGIDDELVRLLARTTATMHQLAPVADADTAWGSPEHLLAEVQGNINVLEQFDKVANSAQRRHVCEFARQRLHRLRDTFLQRKRIGACRECHGDLHLENLAMIDGDVVPFDAVEFEPAFRWVDIGSDLAFLLMDLHARGFAERANQLLDEYLQHTGDYCLLRVLEHYLCYRAMVRAKIAALRSAQLDRAAESSPQASEAAAMQANQLIALAASWCTHPAKPRMFITHGVSGSGKSWLARRLAARIGAVCIRSDVERARLYPDDNDGQANNDRYTAQATQAVYAHLLIQAEHALASGMDVILDATYLALEERQLAARHASEHGVGFCILSLSASRERLEQRIEERARRGDDASQADTQVLAMQLESGHQLAAHEHDLALFITEHETDNLEEIVRRLEELPASV